MPGPVRYVRLSTIIAELGIDASTFWSWRKTGVFNIDGVVLNPHAARQILVFPVEEYEAWKASRPRRMARSPRKTPYQKGPRQAKTITRPEG